VAFVQKCFCTFCITDSRLEHIFGIENLTLKEGVQKAVAFVQKHWCAFCIHHPKLKCSEMFHFWHTKLCLCISLSEIFNKISAWILIVSGIIYTILNLYFSFSGPTIEDMLYEAGFGLLFSILIFVLSFFPGKYYLRISDKESKQNKLTNASLILTISGIALIVLAFFAMLIICPPSTNTCDGLGLTIIFYGIFPAAVLYAIGMLLLMINRFKK
jgi:hypothetical protein